MSVTDRLLLGAAWYPEQEPEREWARDAALMRDLGLDAARIGEFAWSRMQRADGTLTLDWLERVLETLARHGLGAVLCTPTACPPVWLWERYPDLAPVHPDGSKRLFGGRRHASLFHPAFREHALAMRSPCHFVVARATWPVLERLYARQRALRSALYLALLRSLAPECPLCVLEHQIGSSRSTAGGLLPEWQRLWAMECLANGARTLFWFHWRRFRTGCEWRHSAILERDRRPREVFRSLQPLIHERRRLDSDLNGATPQAGAQILVSPLNMLGRDRSSEDSFWMEIQQPDATHTRVPMWMRETARAAFNPPTQSRTAICFRPFFAIIPAPP